MNWLRAIGLRLFLAFLLSFALWVFVSYSQNPDRRIRFDNMPVEAVGLGEGLVLVDSTGLPRTTRPTISVFVEGATSDLQNVSERDLRVYQDLQGLAPGQYVEAIKIEDTRVDQVRVQYLPDPVSLSVRIEQAITRTLPLTIEVSGSVPFSFEALDPRLSLRSSPARDAVVSGPENRVNRVAYIRATADIDRLTSTYNSPRPLEAVDADGKLVDGVVIEPSQVNVQVPIISSVGIKRVPIVPQLIGEPGSGYVVTGVSVEPQFVTLTGSSGPLDDVLSINTVPIDIGNATVSFTRTVALLEPTSARFRFGEPTTAVVTVSIGALDRPFLVTLPIPVELVGANPGLLVSYSPTIVTVSLQGRTGAFTRLDTSKLVATVNLAGVGPGTYTLTPDLALPNGIQLVAPLGRVTVSLRLPATATPELTTPSVVLPTTAVPDSDPTQEPTPPPTALPTEQPTPTETPAPTPSPQPAP